MAALKEEEEEVYCVCRKPYYHDQFMIECDVCKEWFHGSCIGIEEFQGNDIETYHCPNCQPEHGPLVLKRRRNWHRHDYSELNDGSKAIQSGTVVFVNMLKERTFSSSSIEFLYLNGKDLDMEWFHANGFKTPIIVKDPNGLDLTIPSYDFTVADVERYVGSLRELDVIDVSRQDDLKMKMREWVEYYETFPRQSVYNVISLEFSDTKLSNLVHPPSVVREMDWINRHWPKSLTEDCEYQRPLVQKYCLMSVKDSYTDFHVDFGGTSVWYHLIKGEKIFYLIPPTEENLLLYEEWVSSSNQSELFFGNQVKDCHQFTLLPGNTLFIPTGWIHAVLTPKDSLVFGGNFIHRFNIGLQLRIYDMEIRLQTPLKFRHPNYETLSWYAARDFLRELRAHDEQGTRPPEYLITGLKSLTTSLQEWTSTRETLKSHKWEIPTCIKPIRVINEINKLVDILTEEEDRPIANMPVMTTGKLDCAVEGQRSIKLRFSHGQVTRSERDGDKEHITMKLSVSHVTDVKNEKEERRNLQELSDPLGDEDEEEEEDFSENDRSGDDEFVYCKSLTQDDDGAKVNDKEDALWSPRGEYSGLAGGGNGRRKIDKNDEYKEWMTPTKKKKRNSDTDTYCISRNKPKPKTAKQRLGKLLGLDRTGHFLRK